MNLACLHHHPSLPPHPTALGKIQSHATEVVPRVEKAGTWDSKAQRIARHTVATAQEDHTCVHQAPEQRSAASMYPVLRMAQYFQNFGFLGILWGRMHVLPSTHIQNKQQKVIKITINDIHNK